MHICRQRAKENFVSFADFYKKYMHKRSLLCTDDPQNLHTRARLEAIAFFLPIAATILIQLRFLTY
ncbi:MAG: hypothetical protein RMY29_012260 [Nostoc sp. CreGUA01]|nr:hypothetical protein [Nostoc sp. CreGUA01]